MKMIITLRSGVQISASVSRYACSRDRVGNLTGLQWTPAKHADTSVEYVDLREVVLVHSVWEPDDEQYPTEITTAEGT